MIIPKLLHRIWIGKEKMPLEFVRYGISWMEKHPNWKMKLWTDNELFLLQNQEMYDKAKTESEKSDILRLEILKKYGGIYLDTDIECYKNIEPIIKNADFFVCRDADWDLDCPYLNGALMGCTPQHPLINKLINELPIFANKYKNKHVCYRTGPGFVSLTLKDKSFLIPDIKIFNGEYSFHHYAGSWKDIEGVE